MAGINQGLNKSPSKGTITFAHRLASTRRSLDNRTGRKSMRALVRTGVALLWLAMLPAVAFAQASITGVVKDTSGAVLPGVTVEASSPALIEKVRTAVTDGSGTYRITELRPGTYTVTFSLTGFNTVKREGIELAGSFTATVDADMKVGALEETITVSGEAPIVDVQSSTRERVTDAEQITALPTGRNMFALGVLIPGVSISGGTGGLGVQDVGGALGPETRALVAHGGRTEDQRFMMNGVSLSSMIGGGWGGGAIPNATGLQEIVYDTASVSADLSTGGVRINFIAKEGGNQFHGTIFGNFANDSFQTTNVDSALLARSAALANAGTVDRNWDFNPGFGGPLKKDKVWFYLSGRSQGAYLFAPGIYYNKNENDPTKWTYDPDLSRPASIQKTWLDAQARVSFQISQKNKLGVTYTQQDFCACHDNIGPQGANIHAPEAAYDRRFPTQRVVLLDWTAPVTNKLLIEASGIHRVERWGNMNLQERGLSIDPRMIGVLDTAANVPGLGVIANLAYRDRAVTNYNNSWNQNFHWRFNVSYITGSHAAKFGTNDAIGRHTNTSYLVNNLFYRFTNGVPNQFTLNALPNTQKINVDHDFGLFAQDKWTLGRLTLSGGVRYDHFINSFPEQALAPTLYTPNRNVTFASTKNVNLQDITPKSQVAYDLFGNGKTAIKGSLNKYLQGLGTSGFLTGNPNPIALLASTSARSWTDVNRNYVIDCNVLNPAAQDLSASGGDVCGAGNPAFGQPTPNTRFDPELLTGWGNRFYNWEFSASVQQEVMPRVSVDVGYFRRWYGNFPVVDNRAVSPADFDTFSVVAPSDPRLPNGGGYTVSGLKAVKESKYNVFDNYETKADNYGKMTDHWNGIDVTVITRLRSVSAQFGTSTGRQSRDYCDVLDDVPEAAFAATVATFWTLSNVPSTAVTNQGLLPYCKFTGKWQTQAKGVASYNVPKIDVQVSGTYQYLPGPELQALFNATNAFVRDLGRPLPGNNPFNTVNLIEPGTQYGDALNQVDLRFAKLVRFGSKRTMISFDLYNATNTNTILLLNNNFVAGANGNNTWQVPTTILQPRFFKIGAQFDF